ncbi:DsbA family protein [Paractinoplanes durhamensis]|uniref:Membrane protein n=1 Tax=Paractinoplanes durhamensis TaxID=113563 RepID=A0ABQ3YZN5_9ACTN|nr:thioredoxin domain-containing protein [Actinoplanes durhamensis]GIE03035.1 membrane protein [Actinoplanes durhamensis]
MSKHDRLRAKAREVRLAQERAERRRKRIRIAIGAGSLVIVGLLVAIFAVVYTSASHDRTTASGVLVTPANLAASGAIPVGQTSAPVTVEIYLDYMCPACGKFEQANATELDRLLAAGTIKLELHPMNFLDSRSKGTNYSTRTANAVATTADQAADKVWVLSKALYANQPEEGTSGLTDQQIADLATTAGVPQATVDAFKNRTFDTWVTNSNDAAFKAGVQGTPTIKINGTHFEGDVYNAGPLTQAIEQAAGGAS